MEKFTAYKNLFLYNIRVQETNFKEPLNVLSDEDLEQMELHYYNPDIHRASFQLPTFAHKVYNLIRK